MNATYEWMKTQGVAKNDFQAAAIYNGLKLYQLQTEEERQARVMLYRKWRPKTDKKNMLPTAQAFDLAIAGIDPADVVERQIDFEKSL